MMVKFKISTVFLLFALLLYYFFSNIQLIGEGSVSIEILAIFLMLSMLLIIVNILTGHKIFIKKTSTLLLLFLVYLIIRITIDTESIDFIIAKTIDTSTGIVLFLSIGILFSILFKYSFKKALQSISYLKIFNSLFYIFLCYFAYLTFSTTFDLLLNIRVDKFLLEDIGDQYQRPGNFLIISFYIFSYFYIAYSVLNNKNKYSILSIYILLSILNMFNAQIFGSNNGLAGVGGITIATVFYVLFYFDSNTKFYLKSFRINIKNLIISKVAFKLYKSILFSIFILIFFLVIVFNYFELDVSMFRVAGFGEGNTSIDGRIHMWSYFIDNFSYSPLFGNIIVEQLNGTDNYTHSFLGYMLTHMGIFGTILFVIYLVNSFKNISKEYRLVYDVREKALILYSLIVFLGLFILGNIATPMYWIVVWFLIGFIFNPIVLRSNKEVL